MNSDPAMPDPHRDWCQAYVHAWAELSEGLYDPHATWDDAHEAYAARAQSKPEDVAAEFWALATR